MPEDWLFVDSLRLARKLPKLPKSDGTSSLLQDPWVIGFKRTLYLQDLSVALLPARVVFCHITFEDTFFAKSLFR
jgi:hypothetical protein